jgi:flagellar biosynthetic protein FliR
MEELPWMAFAIAVGREVIIGSAMGYVFGLYLVPFRIAGEYIAQEMGLTLGTITDPTRPETTTVVGEFFEITGAFLFFSQDVHHLFLAALHSSFAIQPVGGTILELPVTTQLRSLASATEWGLTLAAPIACCLFIMSLILGLMARAAPQMNLMSFGYAARLMVGMLALFVLWPDLAPHMTAVLQNFANQLVRR